MKTIKFYTYIYALPCENHASCEKVRNEFKFTFYFIIFQSFFLLKDFWTWTIVTSNKDNIPKDQAKDSFNKELKW
jgi:hypothetical protein